MGKQRRVERRTGRWLSLCLICLMFPVMLHAADGVPQADTIRIGDDRLIMSGFSADTAVYAYASKHNPSKATLLSTVLPGLGQAYNRKYWKIPVVYAAIGVSSFLYIRYNNEFQKFRQAYVDYYDTDASTNSFLDFDIPKGVTVERYITVYKDNYRKWRDWAGIAMLLSYALNIVDATVDAHFFDFNIDENLSMQVQPVLLEDIHLRRRIGLNLNLSF